MPYCMDAESVEWPAGKLAVLPETHIQKGRITAQWVAKEE